MIDVESNIVLNEVLERPRRLWSAILFLEQRQESDEDNTACLRMKSAFNGCDTQGRNTSQEPFKQIGLWILKADMGDGAL